MALIKRVWYFGWFADRKGVVMECCSAGIYVVIREAGQWIGCNDNRCYLIWRVPQ